MSHNKNCKIVFLGESGVGKTSIISHFVENEYIAPQTQTTTATFTTKTFTLNSNNKVLSFELWDTAGQEVFRSMAKIFYITADVIVLVYNITSLKTFTEIKNYWLEQIQDNVHKEIQLAIVGNFSDKHKKLEVTEEQGRQLANEVNASFKVISAKDKNDIVDLFQEIGEIYYTHRYERSNDTNNKKGIASIKIKDEDNDDEIERYDGAVMSSNKAC